MTGQAWATLIGFIILSATVPYVGRYETSAMPGGAALVTDRWFGTVSLCAPIEGNITIVCLPRFPPDR
jgi:hypothetical protein